LLLIIGLPIVLLIVFLGGQEPNLPSQTASERPRITAVQERARLELNEAAQSYREENFSEARRHAEAAHEYDPQNKTAPLFIARIIHRQYKPGDQSPENVTQALAAIEAYRRILADDVQNDEAYKAIASLYGAIREDQQQRQWILKRAVDAAVPAEAWGGYVASWWATGTVNMVTSPTNRSGGRKMRDNSLSKPGRSRIRERARFCLRTVWPK
jgi:hypothetical protein